MLYILISLKSESNMGSHLTQKPKIGQKGLREKGIGRGTIIQSFVGNVFYSSKVSVSYYCIRNLKKKQDLSCIYLLYYMMCKVRFFAQYLYIV